MSSRLRHVAQQNAGIEEAGRYTAADGSEVVIRELLAAALAGTVLHQPEEGLRPPRTDLEPVVEVTAEGSLDAARRLGAGAAVLNFASARNPGGGYLGGARAQEEDLCRHALLHPTLLRAPEYYAAHRASDDLRYSDRVIWSPGVPIHRGPDGGLLARPVLADFLTCPAPNAGELLRREPDAGPSVDAVLRRRAGRVLAVAAHHGATRLVLGAWGCGVFRNDPAAVADAFGEQLDGPFAGAFEHVVFAVWDRAEPSANRTAFERRFGA
ncbi:TIGR02452 family protein [Streptacidiphilus monticola]|uniref:TIGR02452 family protein n=1 Tax=Streptacidiphilus monticola TaxID=2161674 RepID=A0ABW1FU24_9ACTN